MQNKKHKNYFRTDVTFKSKNSPKYDNVQNFIRHVLIYSVKLITISGLIRIHRSDTLHEERSRESIRGNEYAMHRDRYGQTTRIKRRRYRATIVNMWWHIAFQMKELPFTHAVVVHSINKNCRKIIVRHHRRRQRWWRK